MTQRGRATTGREPREADAPDTWMGSRPTGSPAPPGVEHAGPGGAKRFREGAWKGSSHEVRWRVPSDVYEPFDDTRLLLDVLERDLAGRGRFVEVGCGSGVVSILAALMGHEVEACDVTPEALEATRANAARNGVEFPVRLADLGAGIPKAGAIVAFNAPYLPTAESDKVEGPLNVALDGGPDGLKVSRRFLKTVLPEGPAAVYLVVSDLAPVAELKALAQGMGWTIEERAKRSFFMERLLLWRVSRRDRRPGGT